MGSLLRPRSRRRLLVWALALCGAVSAASALAGSLQVAPISVEFSAAQQAQGLWMSNTGTEPLFTQVRVMEWRQVDQRDQLVPTDALVASPPIVQVQPGQRQLVRLVRRNPAAPSSELAYRVLIDELPDGEHSAVTTGLNFLFRYSIPVFVLPPDRTPRFETRGIIPTDFSTLSASLLERDGKAWLRIANQGQRRVRISQLTLVDTHGNRNALVPGLFGYVLAGQQMEWALSAPVNALRHGVLKAKFDDSREEQTLPVDHAGR